MDDLQKYLTKTFNGEYSHLFARGSTGLYCLFKATKAIKGPGEVIIPSICCDTIPISILYAGLKPVFADVEMDTLCLSYETVLPLINKNTVAILLVYIFGIPFDVSTFAKFKTDYGVFLIEDIAQATGGLHKNRLLGSFFDYTILSFADSKIVKGQAGAIVHRDTTLIEPINKIISTLPPSPQPNILSKIELSWRNLTHALFDLARADPSINVSKHVSGLLPYYQQMIVRKNDTLETSSIISQLENIENEREKRYIKYLAYKEKIINEDVTLFEFPSGSVCWRFPLLSKEPNLTIQITKTLRNNGILVSNHYFPQDKFFENKLNENSAFIGPRIINLWVDDLVKEEDILKTIDIINRFHN
jgi:dTDP-4-amino-4,6-dideoxygalactose transaminase